MQPLIQKTRGVLKWTLERDTNFKKDSYTFREKQKNQSVKSTCKVCRAWSPEEKLQVLGSSKRHQFETKRLETLAKLYIQS